MACDEDVNVAGEPAGTQNVANPRLVEADFRVVPSRQVSPCVFSGTLGVELPLYASQQASTPFIRAQFVQVDSLAIPVQEGTRAAVHLSWPIGAVAWASPDSFPLSLSRRLEVRTERYWLAPGARVTAWSGSRAGTAIVSRPYPSGFGDLSPSGGSVRQEQPCSLLELPVEGLFERSMGPNQVRVIRGVARWADVSAGAALHAQPNDPQHATIPPTQSVAVLDERGPWVEVRSYGSLNSSVRGGVDFTGWIRSSAIAPGLPLALAFGPVWLKPTHRSREEIVIRSAPSPTAAVVGTMVSQLPFRALKHEGGYVEVHLPGLERGGLWMAESDLCRSARAE